MTCNNYFTLLQGPVGDPGKNGTGSSILTYSYNGPVNFPFGGGGGRIAMPENTAPNGRNGVSRPNKHHQRNHHHNTINNPYTSHFNGQQISPMSDPPGPTMQEPIPYYTFGTLFQNAPAVSMDNIPSIYNDMYIVAPRAGTLKNLRVFAVQNADPDNIYPANGTIFTASAANSYNFIATALTVSGTLVPSTPLLLSDTTDQVAVNAGDLIALQGNLGDFSIDFAGGLIVQATMEFD